MVGLFSSLKSVLARITKRGTMQQRFDSVTDFRGLDYVSIVSRVGTWAKDAQPRDNQQTARTWSEGDYSITLLFDGTGVCLGVEEERS